MVDFVKPDLAKADENMIARLVVSGRVQLSEIPDFNRDAVARKVDDLRAEIAAREEAEASVDLADMKVPELRKMAKELNIEGASKMKKADLIEALGG